MNRKFPAPANLRPMLSIVCCLYVSLQSAVAGPMPRVLSADNCADQYVLALAEREQIVAVSPDAAQYFSYYADAAGDIPRLQTGLEELLVLSPDIVISSWGWAPGERALPERYGMEFVRLEYGHAPDVIERNLRAVAAAIGRPAAAERIIRQMYAGIERARQRGKQIAERQQTAVYITPSGATGGGDTLLDSVLTLAGVTNLIAEQGKEGWRYIDLELLLQDDPDLLIASFFDLGSQDTDNWSIARHQVMQNLLAEKPVVYIPARYLSCSAWYFVEAVDYIQDQLDSTGGQSQSSAVGEIN